MTIATISKCAARDDEQQTRDPVRGVAQWIRRYCRERIKDAGHVHGVTSHTGTGHPRTAIAARSTENNDGAPHPGFHPEGERLPLTTWRR